MTQCECRDLDGCVKHKPERCQSEADELLYAGTRELALCEDCANHGVEMHGYREPGAIGR